MILFLLSFHEHNDVQKYVYTILQKNYRIYIFLNYFNITNNDDEITKLLNILRFISFHLCL